MGRREQRGERRFCRGEHVGAASQGKDKYGEKVRKERKGPARGNRVMIRVDNGGKPGQRGWWVDVFKGAEAAASLGWVSGFLPAAELLCFS